MEWYWTVLLVIHILGILIYYIALIYTLKTKKYNHKWYQWIIIYLSPLVWEIVKVAVDIRRYKKKRVNE